MLTEENRRRIRDAALLLAAALEDDAPGSWRGTAEHKLEPRVSDLERAVIEFDQRLLRLAQRVSTVESETLPGHLFEDARPKRENP